jgi:hypothetical protein
VTELMLIAYPTLYEFSVVKSAEMFNETEPFTLHVTSH